MTIETFTESAEQIRATSCNVTTGTFTSYVQVLCPGCGHAEHPGATCMSGLFGTAGQCQCFMPAMPAPQITFGWFGGKQPFRCPVCIGSGRTSLPVSTDMSGVACHACDGHGIVWGPP